MSNYDRKLWERLCRAEEESKPSRENPLKPFWEALDQPWRPNTTGIYEQLRASGQIRDVAQPAPPIDFAQLQADLYALARARGRSIFDEQAEEYRRRRALNDLETAPATPRIRWSLSEDEIRRLQENFFRDVFGNPIPTQPIDP